MQMKKKIIPFVRKDCCLKENGMVNNQGAYFQTGSDQNQMQPHQSFHFINLKMSYSWS